MLDEELFNALKEVEASDKGGLFVLKPEGQSEEGRKTFDHLCPKSS